jgi:hypothetical protein
MAFPACRDRQVNRVFPVWTVVTALMVFPVSTVYPESKVLAAFPELRVLRVKRVKRPTARSTWKDKRVSPDVMEWLDRRAILDRKVPKVCQDRVVRPVRWDWEDLQVPKVRRATRDLDSKARKARREIKDNKDLKVLRCKCKWAMVLLLEGL